MVGLRQVATANRSLAPREHGAYGQLFAPLSAALLATRITLPGLAFAIAGICAFYAHEPLLVVTGQRGKRAERELTDPAHRRLVVLASALSALGIVGLLLSDAVTRWAALAVATLGLSAAILSRFEMLHSALGEAWAGTVLASLGIPIAIAGGMPWRQSVAITSAWALAFAAGVFGVKAVIAYRKTHARGKTVWGMAVVIAGLVADAFWARGPVIAVAPLTLVSLVLMIVVPSPKALRTMGWTLVGFTVLAVVLLVVTARVSLV